MSADLPSGPQISARPPKLDASPAQPKGSSMKHGKHKLGRYALWLLPVAILAGALAFKLTVDKQPRLATDAPPIPVRTIRPELGDVTRTLSLNAYVESESMVTVLPMVSGILQELFVDVGQSVRKDQIIARIDAQRFELQLKQAEAAYFSAKSTYDRLAQLYKTGATTQQNYEQAKGQYEAYASQYELARLQLDYANVKSPIDGVVLIKHLSAGSIAAPERPLVTVGDVRDLVVRVRVPERYYEDFLNGATMPIDVSREGGSSFAGRIKSISPFVSAETKNFEVQVSLDGAEGILRPGMFVQVAFELRRWPGVYSLPYTALGSGSRLWWAQDGIARAAEFKPADGSDSRFIVGPEWVERDIIVEGHWFAREGSPIVVLPPPSAAESRP